MPALSTVAAATLAATLTISPAIAPPPSEDGTRNRSSTCTQTNTAGTTATTGQLSPQQLDQATEIIREARELLTLVTTAEGNDPRASSVAATLRAAGFTPAVQTGWRQLAVDTSDALLTTEDPEMQRVARILARNGHGPTAADVQRPAPSLGRAPTGTAPAPGSPFRAHPGDDAGPQMMTAEAPEQSARPSGLRTALGSGAGGRAMLHAADSTNHCTSSPEDAAAQLDKLVEALELLTGADRDAQALLDQLADLNDDGRPRGEEARPPSTDSSDEPSTDSSWQEKERDLIDKLSAAADDPEAQDLAADLLGGDGGPPSTDDQQSSDQGDGQQGEDGAPAAADPVGPEAPAAPANAGTWDKLAECESSGDWSINTGNGYHGGLQFDKSTWAAYGGEQYAPTADQATREQQIEIAEKVRSDRGSYSAWPSCSEQLGLPK